MTAQRLRDALRTADTPARLGGDEFAVLLVDIAPEHVEVVVERILAKFAVPFDLCGRSHTIGASIGVAMADSGSMDADALVRNADAAMYVRKHADKGGYSVYGPAAAPVRA
jgi:diguanylate cyclase (GGDEF)-like protein